MSRKKRKRVPGDRDCSAAQPTSSLVFFLWGWCWPPAPTDGETSLFWSRQRHRAGARLEEKQGGRWEVGLAGGPHPTCLSASLQLNQNLNDVLVSLEKQHGSNTFTVKAQLRCAGVPEGAGGLREVSTAGAKAFLQSPVGWAFLAWPPVLREQRKAPLLLAVPHLRRSDPGQSVAPPVQAWLPPREPCRSGASTALQAGLGLKDSGDPRAGSPPSTTHCTEESPAS